MLLQECWRRNAALYTFTDIKPFCVSSFCSNGCFHICNQFKVYSIQVILVYVAVVKRLWYSAKKIRPILSQKVVCLHLAPQLRPVHYRVTLPVVVKYCGVSLSITDAHKPSQHVKLQTMWGTLTYPNLTD